MNMEIPSLLGGMAFAPNAVSNQVTKKRCPNLSSGCSFMPKKEGA